jgi:hypothetical protein
VSPTGGRATRLSVSHGQVPARRASSRLARAAKELKVTKATASRRLAALETALSVRLVERKPAGLVLTAAGHDAISAAERKLLSDHCKSGSRREATLDPAAPFA